MKMQTRSSKQIILLFSCLAVVALLSWAKLLSAAGAGDPKSGERLYKQYCVPCHGKEGRGDGTRVTVENLDPQPRNHTDGNYMNNRSDLHLFKVIYYGGYSMNLSHIMPPWNHILSKQDVLDVVAFVRTLAEPPYRPQGGGTGQDK